MSRSAKVMAILLPISLIPHILAGQWIASGVSLVVTLVLALLLLSVRTIKEESVNLQSLYYFFQFCVSFYLGLFPNTSHLSKRILPNNGFSRINFHKALHSSPLLILFTMTKVSSIISTSRQSVVALFSLF